MNGKIAKMLRRVRQDTHKGKAIWYSFDSIERAEIHADYIERGDTARKQYTEAKKLAKKERINE